MDPLVSGLNGNQRADTSVCSSSGPAAPDRKMPTSKSSRSPSKRSRQKSAPARYRDSAAQSELDAACTERDRLLTNIAANRGCSSGGEVISKGITEALGGEATPGGGECEVDDNTEDRETPTPRTAAKTAFWQSHTVARGRARGKQLNQMSEKERKIEKNARMEKMRLAARECRLRKKMHIDKLEQVVASFVKRDIQNRATIEALQNQLKDLKRKITPASAGKATAEIVDGLYRDGRMNSRNNSVNRETIHVTQSKSKRPRPAPLTGLSGGLTQNPLTKSTSLESSKLNPRNFCGYGTEKSIAALPRPPARSLSDDVRLEPIFEGSPTLGLPTESQPPTPTGGEEMDLLGFPVSDGVTASLMLV